MDSGACTCLGCNLCQGYLEAFSGAWLTVDKIGNICYATPAAWRWLNGSSPPADQERVRGFIKSLIGSEDDYGILSTSMATLQSSVSKAGWCDYARLINLRPVASIGENVESYVDIISKLSQALRGPVSKLGLFSELMINGRPDRRDYYGEILSQETGRLTQLIENLSLLSQLANPSGSSYSPIALGRLVKAIQDSLPSQLNRQTALYQVASSSSAQSVRANPRLIGHAVTNLLAFPRDGSSKEKAVIYVGSRGVWVSIALHLPGFYLPAEQLPNLFEPFAQGKIDLELAVAQAIISHHGGHITVKGSETGKNAAIGVFTLWLPACIG